MHSQFYFIRLLLYLPTAPTDIYTLSLHDALPICTVETRNGVLQRQAHLDQLVLDLIHRLLTEVADVHELGLRQGHQFTDVVDSLDRKSTRLNSSHVKISYAVFCLKKKTTKPQIAV